MKILFFTDTHIRGTTPKNRKDDLVDTLGKKFNEIVEISNSNNVDFVLHGGDLFDRPDVSISIVSKFVTILNKFKAPIYIISGNHDVYGHNPQTIHRTMLGLFNAMGIIHLIHEGEVVFLRKDDINVQLTGQPYIYSIDEKINISKYRVEKIDKKADFSIHMVHGMLLDRPFIKGIPYTLVDDIKDTKADITLAGHYHSGFGIIKSDDKYFVNPGSIIRITNSLKEIERIPQVVMITLKDDIKIELIPLKSALPGEEVLDRQEIENFIFKNERLTQFKQSVDSTANFQKLDINEILLNISLTEEVSDKVKQEALKRISLSQMKNTGDE
ncbi:metallophosphoesterase family protein [Sporanaerobacter acetigenes]|uniref:DNA repair exonuclease SbcCD nuclease subunit n=1 Tax=Sporanaerobacter acetigenes DSM 13106 TaxID=1123281 RepID=A0A1M5XKB2_9FIRM|nr:metallophosphoesterase [Sporanaerobacter acetigenes]SHI00277.1 DNA repair exonuclease SbcCD nuclease subunit [Sporanaerobacter acetigenes DSM 13106]